MHNKKSYQMLEIEQYVFLHLSLIYFLFIETNGIIIHYSHVYIIILVVVICLVIIIVLMCAVLWLQRKGEFLMFTDDTMAKRKSTKGQATIYKTYT